MDKFENEELEEAIRAITSTINKSEKVLLKLKTGTFQHTMTVQGIKAYYIAIDLIKREIEINTEIKAKREIETKKEIETKREIDTKRSADLSDSKDRKQELEEAHKTLTSFISRVEKVQPKFERGTPQHTLAVRRIKAFYISTELIKRELLQYI